MALSFLIAFLWAVKNGQYKDTYTPSVRILFDDNDLKEDAAKGKEKTNSEKHNSDNL